MAEMKLWRYEINYGPDNEADWAMVYDNVGMFLGNFRMHYATAIVAAMNRPEPAAPSRTQEVQESIWLLSATEEWSGLLAYIASLEANVAAPTRVKYVLRENGGLYPLEEYENEQSEI